MIICEIGNQTMTRSLIAFNYLKKKNNEELVVGVCLENYKKRAIRGNRKVKVEA